MKLVRTNTWDATSPAALCTYFETFHKKVNIYDIYFSSLSDDDRVFKLPRTVFSRGLQPALQPYMGTLPRMPRNLALPGNQRRLQSKIIQSLLIQICLISPEMYHHHHLYLLPIMLYLILFPLSIHRPLLHLFLILFSLITTQEQTLLQ